MMEIWKPIAGYEGHYEVSNLGRVKSLKRSEKIMKPNVRKKGYLKVMLSKNNKSKGYFVHRLVCNAFLENPLKKPQVNHKDGNVTNNCVSNLEWCTQSENMRHAFNELGRTAATKGKHLPEEWRKKISESNKGRHGLKGRIVSEETRQKLREANLGKKHSAETRKKLSESHKGKSVIGKRSRLITYCGKTQTLQKWAEELEIPRIRLQMRLKRGWSVDRAFSEPKIFPKGRERRCSNGI